MPKKPTGRKGRFRVTIGPDGPTSGFVKMQFPTQKEEIERFILDLFVREMTKRGATIINAIKNAENDFDFTLELLDRKISLDLMEIIYRDDEGPPYDSDQIMIKSYKYAEQIRDAIMAKSVHYGRVSGRPIHLLTYITHWRFVADEAVIQLVQHMLQQSPPIMENVFFLTPTDDKSGRLRVFYPSENPLNGRDPNVLRDNVYFNLDSAKFELSYEKRQPLEPSMPSEIEDVSRIPNSWVEEDGLHVVIQVDLANGKTFGLRLPYDQLDFTNQALLMSAVAAYERQVEKGILPSSKSYINDPMTIESFKVIRVNEESHLLIQFAGRGREGPLGMGSFIANKNLARALGRKLLESADLLARDSCDQ